MKTTRRGKKERCEQNCTKQCFVILERLDQKTLKKFLQKYGLKLSSRNITCQPVGNKNNYLTHSRTKKITKTNRKEMNSDNFALKKNYKGRRKRIKSLCNSGDETCYEISGAPTKPTVGMDALLESESEKVGLYEILTTADSRVEDSVALTSSETEIQKERIKDQGNSESQLKNAVLAQYEDVYCGRTDESKISSSAENGIEILKEGEKPFAKRESITSQNDKKKQLIVDSESAEKTELEDGGYESREDGEDDRITIIFEKELHTNVDLEEIFESEGKEIKKKVKNREIMNRKRQKMVKFKRRSMTGIKKTKAKVESKSKNKLVEKSEDEEEIPEKSNECVNEECLKEVCYLVKRLHDLSRIIYMLQRELPKNNDLTVHFHKVINSQLENFHKEIRKGQNSIIKCYEKMLTFYTDTSHVALEIGKRTSLSVEEVVNIISLCIIIEGHCESEKSGNGGNQRIFEPVNPSNGLQKIINDNIVRIIKNKINQLEGLSGIRRHEKDSSSIGFHSSHCIMQQMYQMINKSTDILHSQFDMQTKEQTFNNTISSAPSQDNIQVKQKKVNSTCFPPSQSGVEQKQGTVSLIGSQSSWTNTQLKRKKLNSPGPSLSLRSMQQYQEINNSSGSQFSRPNTQSKQQITNNFTGVPPSLLTTDLKQQRVTDSTGFPTSQPKIQKKYPTVNRTTNSSPAQYISQPKWKTMSSTGFQQPDVQNQQTGLLPSESNIRKKHSSTDFSDNLRKRNTSLTNPKEQIVNVTGCLRSRIKIPSGGGSYRPKLYYQPYDRTSKSTAKGREETIYSFNHANQMTSHINPQTQRKPPRQHGVLMFKNPGPGQVSQHGLNQRNQRLGTTPPYLVPQTPKQYQPVVASYPMHCGIPAKNIRRHQTSHHKVPPQRNVPPANMNIPSTTLPVIGTLPRYDCPSNQVSDYYIPTTVGKVAKQNSGFPYVTTNTYHGVNGSEQVTSTHEGKMNIEATVSTRVVSHNKLFRVPLDLSEKSSKPKTEVVNSEMQQDLDPTIPQKLTMKNFRLQAGPALDTEVADNKTTGKLILPSKDTENELKNFDRKNSQSRVYVCAQNDCKKPGVRICKSCLSVIYCSTNCQYRHWVLKHKAECDQLKALRG